MKLLVLLPALLAFLQLCSADFYLYRGDGQNYLFPGDPFDVWHVYDSHPTCAQIKSGDNYWASWNDRGDVSGTKTGVRCEGEGCTMFANGNYIQVLEMHFTNSPLLHFTIYKNRGYPFKMYGLDGRTYGECTVSHSEMKECWWAAFVGKLRVTRKLHCKAPWTADQIRRGGGRFNGGRLAGGEEAIEEDGVEENSVEEVGVERLPLNASTTA